MKIKQVLGYIWAETPKSIWADVSYYRALCQHCNRNAGYVQYVRRALVHPYRARQTKDSCPACIQAEFYSTATGTADSLNRHMVLVERYCPNFHADDFPRVQCDNTNCMRYQDYQEYVAAWQIWRHSVERKNKFWREKFNQYQK